MADLTEEQKKSYWRYNIKLTDHSADHLVRRHLSDLGPLGRLGSINFRFLGFPLGYYMAAQGSLAIFVIEIAVYAYLMNKLDLQLRHPRGGISYESSQNFRSLYDLFPGRDHPHRHRRATLRLVAAVDRLDLHGSVAGHLHRHRHHHAHFEPRPILCRRPRRSGRVQRHGHGLGLDVGGVVYLHGRRAFRPGIRRTCLCHGLDRRLSLARGIFGALPAAIWRLHDSGLSWRPLWRQFRAHHRRRRRDRLLVHLSDRSGHRRRA